MCRSGWWVRWTKSAAPGAIAEGYKETSREEGSKFVNIFYENDGDGWYKYRQVTVEASGVEKEICEAQEKVYRYDHGVLDACGLAEGEELNFLEFTRKVQEKVIDTGLRAKICGDCQWNNICSEKTSRWTTNKD